MNYFKVGLSALLATAAAFASVSCGQGETSLTSAHAEDTSGAPGENTAADGYYTSLRVSVSDDLGRSWEHHSTVCEYIEPSHKFKGVWEPCLGEIDGKLTCFYANDFPSITSMQNIESLTWTGNEWSDRLVVSDGKSHDSRDGMPVWIRLSDGTYAMVIESSHSRISGHPFVIRLMFSDDGKKWSAPRTVYIPVTAGSKAGAPGIAELPPGPGRARSST